MPTYRLNFHWAANLDIAGITGYRLYAGRQSGVYTQSQNMGNVTSGSYVVDTTDRNPWYFALTALTATTESGFSAELQQGFLSLNATEAF